MLKSYLKALLHSQGRSTVQPQAAPIHLSEATNKWNLTALHLAEERRRSACLCTCGAPDRSGDWSPVVRISEQNSYWNHLALGYARERRRNAAAAQKR